MPVMPTPDELALWNASTKRPITLQMKRSDAQSYRHRLYQTRKSLGNTGHWLYPLIQDVIITIEPADPKLPPDTIVHLTMTRGARAVNDIVRQALTEEELNFGEENKITDEQLAEIYEEEKTIGTFVMEDPDEVEQFSLDAILGNDTTSTDPGPEPDDDEPKPPSRSKKGSKK